MTRLKEKDEGSTPQDVLNAVLNKVARALRTIAYGYDGENYPAIRLNASGELYIAPISSVKTGQKTLTNTGSAVPMAGSTAVYSLTIKALSANTSAVYVGNSTQTTATGFPLKASESISLDIDNLNDLYIIVKKTGEGISYLSIK